MKDFGVKKTISIIVIGGYLKKQKDYIFKKFMREKKIVAIIQARITSTRLPGKVLMEIEGKSMLWHVLNRLKFSKKLDDIILAIPNTKENDILEKFAKDNKVRYFKGSEEDVLSRYYETAQKFNCDPIARVTSDCPLIDPEVVDLVVEKYLDLGADYTSNTIKKTFPRGLETEVFSFRILERAYTEAKNDLEREHVTLYFVKYPEIFRLVNVVNEKDLSYMRWTVDEAKDLEFVREVYRRLYKEGKIFSMKDIVSLLKKYPELMEINKGVKQKYEG